MTEGDNSGRWNGQITTKYQWFQSRSQIVFTKEEIFLREAERTRNALPNQGRTKHLNWGTQTKLVAHKEEKTHS